MLFLPGQIKLTMPRFSQQREAVNRSSERLDPPDKKQPQLTKLAYFNASCQALAAA